MSGAPSLIRRPQGPPLARLAGREREVAEIVYSCGRGITAEEVRLSLSDPLSNSAVRTMLCRLTAKGILTYRKATGKTFAYLPAVTDEAAREAAILRLAQDYFAGSLGEAAMTVLSLARRRRAAPLHRAVPMLEAPMRPRISVTLS